MATDVQGVKYAGFGRCLYCSATEDLRDEHIVPYSLQGSRPFGDASDKAEYSRSVRPFRRDVAATIPAAFPGMPNRTPSRPTTPAGDLCNVYRVREARGAIGESAGDRTYLRQG